MVVRAVAGGSRERVATASLHPRVQAHGGPAVKRDSRCEPRLWRGRYGRPSAVATISSLLADHVRLRVRSVDRIFLAGYVGSLQSEGLVVRFCWIAPRGGVRRSRRRSCSGR